MIDPDGYRPGVGMVVSNQRRQVVWARRIGRRMLGSSPRAASTTVKRPRMRCFASCTRSSGSLRSPWRCWARRPGGFATTSRGSSCAATGTRSASGRSSAGFSYGCCRMTVQFASMPTQAGVRPLAMGGLLGAGPGGGVLQALRLPARARGACAHPGCRGAAEQRAPAFSSSGRIALAARVSFKLTPIGCGHEARSRRLVLRAGLGTSPSPSR